MPNRKKSSKLLLAEGQYVAVLISSEAAHLIQECLDSILHPNTDPTCRRNSAATEIADLDVAVAAFNAFLQVNVTGPVLDDQASLEDVFLTSFRMTTNDSHLSLRNLRTKCLETLTIDGVAPYAYIPLLELFTLARYLFLSALESPHNQTLGAKSWIRWQCLRIHSWHYRLLTQPSLGGSTFAKAAQWSDVPSLQETLVSEIAATEGAMFDAQSQRSREEKIEFLLEKANIAVLLGFDSMAREAVKAAASLNRFAYAISGALGKRTKFQEQSISQLVVLAKSGATQASTAAEVPKPEAKPSTLMLNDDTLLEDVDFCTQQPSVTQQSPLPAVLKDLATKPDQQPQLTPFDQIILLADATIKDSFSPTDSLTAEEVLPFANRVLADKSTNWQIYTHALLVRSRLEMHRSRTVERGVLQMQALVDQIIADTATTRPPLEKQKTSVALPTISVTADPPSLSPKKRTVSHSGSIFPASKRGESAPPQDRLRYIHTLFSPPKWHLESEMAYAWAGVGSLVSALEIFKRLRLWAEVALCLAGSGASANDDEEGRGSGAEAKARAVLRWQLFQPTKTNSGPAKDAFGLEEIDLNEIDASNFQGAERSPLPANAPRLFCILGDLESETSHYKRAWEISHGRYARAQKALGEHYLRQRDWNSAREAYERAVKINRLSSDLWNRLGDINLRLARFSDAAEAYSRALGSANDASGGEDARTWSNLGSALWSLHCELASGQSEALAGAKSDKTLKKKDVEANHVASAADKKISDDPDKLLLKSLAAYKRGAKLSSTNWRIWENVVTIASKIRPEPAYLDLIYAVRQVLQIRKSEVAVDVDVLRLLLRSVVLSQTPKTVGDKKYEPPRASLEKSVIDLFETAVVPLITTRDDLWELISQERAWRRDYAGVVEASQKAWRAAMTTGGVGDAASTAPSSSLAVLDATTVSPFRSEEHPKPRLSWAESEEAWDNWVSRTDELVSVLENYGSRVNSIGTRWKGRARMAVRSILGKGKERWEGSEGWKVLKQLEESLKQTEASQ